MVAGCILSDLVVTGNLEIKICILNEQTCFLQLQFYYSDPKVYDSLLEWILVKNFFFAFWDKKTNTKVIEQSSDETSWDLPVSKNALCNANYSFPYPTPQLEDMDVLVADHVSRVHKTNFLASWEEIGDECEMQDTYALTQMNSLEGNGFILSRSYFMT